ncbi:MAG: ArsA family ATPase [Deltaproteobacteria bacterium]|nr:ArsA family ATPase [Deltaproteobacteria bacterium]
MAHDLFERRVFFVVGKGGVGKSTVAALLAVAVAERGKRVLLAQMGPGRRLAEVLGVDGGSEAPAEVFPGLCFLTIDGETALGEYLGLVLAVKRVHRLVVGSKLYHHFVAAAPGLKELMTVGKIWYEEQLESGRGRKWDAIVVDAPATGHSLQYLRMPAAAYEAFGAGLVRREARRVLDLLEDPGRTAVCPVTTAEEMPVNETTEMYTQLRERLRMPLGVLFVNRVHAAPLAPEAVPAAPAGASSLVVDVLRCGREEAGWSAINAHYLARLRANVPMPTVELPFLFSEEFGLSEVRRLLGHAERQLATLPAAGAP